MGEPWMLRKIQEGRTYYLALKKNSILNFYFFRDPGQNYLPILS